MTFLFGRRTPAPDPQNAGVRLHDALVAAIRRPVFYTDYGVPDTFEGRFDLLVLHAGLVLRRLRQAGPAGEGVAQQLVDTMFARFDVAMRELGVSDIGVPKRMKRLAQAFRGRTAAYHAALDAGDDRAFGDAIARNVVGPAGRPDALAAVMLRFDQALATVDLTEPGACLPVVPDPVVA